MSRFGAGPGASCCLVEVLSLILCPQHVGTEDVAMVSADSGTEYCLHGAPASADLSAAASRIIARDAITFGLRRSLRFATSNTFKEFDREFRIVAENILQPMSTDQWAQAELPLRHGGLGLRPC
eukprot:PhM_4_TR16558/c0_g1_i1/m.101238